LIGSVHNSLAIHTCGRIAFTDITHIVLIGSVRNSCAIQTRGRIAITDIANVVFGRVCRTTGAIFTLRLLDQQRQNTNIEQTSNENHFLYNNSYIAISTFKQSRRAPLDKKKYVVLLIAAQQTNLFCKPKKTLFSAKKTYSNIIIDNLIL
jgi:hypothetical protein